MSKEIKQRTQTPDNGHGHKPEPRRSEKVVEDTKQPAPINQPIRKTDPSHHSFADEEE